jgi:hypothetical protein
LPTNALLETKVLLNQSQTESLRYVKRFLFIFKTTATKK